MSNTVNNYTETDLGNISLNPRGEYDNSAAYEYLDTVSYRGGSYFCLAELETTITGIAPDAGRDSEHWQMIAAPGDMTPEYTAAYNDVIKKAVQVETSRAAVELAQQEIEAVQTDVQQLHSDTVQAAQEAENSKNSAANSAQSAEQSRKTVSESEQNINRQIAGFDSRVSEAVEQSKEEINTTKQQAIDTITNQQTTSVNTVKTEGEKIITRVGNDAKTVADDRATVEEATQTVLNNAQEVARNAQTVASNTENAAASAEGAKTSADNAAQSAKSVEDASKQIEQNKKDVASLKEDVSNKITKFYASNQGETHITDSDNGKIQDMMLYGKSSQDGTPTPENPVKIKSIVNPTVKVCGNNFYSGSDLIGLTKAYTTDFMPVILHKKKIFISFDVFSDTSNGNYLITVQYFDANKEKIGANGKADLVGNNISHANFNFDGSNAGNNNEELDFKNVLYVKITFDIYDTTATEITYKNIMVSAVDSDFEPYKPIQTVTLPYTLNAIPVKSGGNVTINGQQYVADYVDVGKKKRVEYTFSRRISPDEIKGEILGKNSCYISDNTIVKPSTDKEIGHIMCSHLIQESWGNVVNKGIQGISLNSEVNYIGITIASCKTVADYKDFFKNNNVTIMYQINPIYSDLLEKNSELSTYYPVTNISINSEQLDGYTVFNYPISMENGWDYVKQQLNDNRDYIYDMDLQSAEAYVNSEYAVALTELEV